jgi:5-methylcytosine-specific restriction endonuclease McrA
MAKSFAFFRSIAFDRQAGRCYYCGLPMWTNDPLSFARQYNITTDQAKRLQCTAEHLVARQDGGANSLSNLVAACKHCNMGRHKYRNKHNPAPNPEQYKYIVQKRMSRKRWHGEWVFWAMNRPGFSGDSIS